MLQRNWSRDRIDATCTRCSKTDHGSTEAVEERAATASPQSKSIDSEKCMGTDELYLKGAAHLIYSCSIQSERGRKEGREGNDCRCYTIIERRPTFLCTPSRGFDVQIIQPPAALSMSSPYRIQCQPPGKRHHGWSLFVDHPQRRRPVLWIRCKCLEPLAREFLTGDHWGVGDNGSGNFTAVVVGGPVGGPATENGTRRNRLL